MTTIHNLKFLFVPRALAVLLTSFSALHPAGAAGAEANGTATEMNRILTAAFPANAPGAAVLVMQKGTVKLRKGYGLANLQGHVPMDPSEALPICSLTKQFTAVAILQLAEAGKLKLTDNLAKWVPDYPTDGAKVTLSQLLSHMSGIPSVEEQPEWRKTWADDLTPNQVLDLTRNKPLAFAPGSNFKYSNTGYILLGRVIEKASGQNYPDYVRTHLFTPANMAHSRYPDGTRPIPGYSRSGNKWENAAAFSISQAYSAGALLSTVDDMWEWEKALQSGNLVGDSLLQDAHVERLLPDGRGVHYGYGWEINKLGNHNVIEHGGGMPGYAAYEVRVPDADVYLVILCNSDSPSTSLHTLAVNLLRIALAEPIAPLTALPASAMEDFAGTYRIAAEATFVVTAQSNILYGQLGPGRRVLQKVAPDEFATPGDEWHLTFSRDANQHVQKLLVRTDGPGPELVWPRVE